MGPNRQRKPRVGRGSGRGRGRAAAPADSPAKQAPSMITSAGRDLIIDVLHHAATGGSVPVPEKHFDAHTGTRITLHRNSPLSPTETLQRLLEALGFPQDLVAQYLADLARSTADFPVFSSVTELTDEGSRFQPFLVQSCFELFNCMVWFQREEGDADESTELNPEDGDQVLMSEVETLETLFSDSFLGKKHFDDDDTHDRELYFSFMSGDSKAILVAIRLPDYYPAEPPTIFLQPLSTTLTHGQLPPLSVAPSCTKDLSAANRRAVIDAAIEAINGFCGTGCLMPLVSAIGGAVSSVVEMTAAVAAATKRNEPNGESLKRHDATEKRKAFLGALTGKQTAAADDDDNQDRFIQVSMPKKVELATVEAVATDTAKTRREFLASNASEDAALRRSWERLQHGGTLSAARTALPAHLVREQLRQALDAHNVVVIGGETGSGKTTQIPQYLFEFFCEEGRGSSANIVCTQPRRLAATSVALRVAEERGEAVGGTVGYSIRLENCVSKSTRITYCTTGIVLRRLQTDKFLGRVSHIVVDEIHERGVDTDFLLILLRDLVSRRSDLKVVLMSATMDSDLFSRYFGGAPIISIKGRTFPVTVMHLEQIIPEVGYVLEDGSPYERPNSSTSREARMRNTRKNILSLDMDDVDDDKDQQEDIRSMAKEIQASPQTLKVLSRMNTDVINYEMIEYIVEHIERTIRTEGAVLVFLPGMAEIQRCMEQLKSNPHLVKSCCFYNLHSSLGSSAQQGVFKRPARGVRKVILGTNIMETSITIDDAVFVIDTGKAKENRYNARKSLSELVTVNISKANCRQRQGRAGRVRDGFCFRLFTEAQFSAFEDHQLCEMHRVPLESLILQIYALHLGDEVEYLQKALTPPEEKAINSSVKVLTTLGALTREKRLTSLGQHLANLPLDVRVGKMIIHGALLQCIDPVLTIAACLAIRSPFITLVDFRPEVEAIRRAFAKDHLSDQMASWFAYSKWVSALSSGSGSMSEARKVCTDCYLSPAALLQIQSTKRQYEHYLCEAGFIEGADTRRVSSNRFLFPPHTTMDGSVYEAGGEHFNANSSSARCILACIVAGLYPNVARVKPARAQSNVHGRMVRFVTFDGSDCLVHPSSVAGKETKFPSQLLVYVDKVKTSAVFLREVSLISPLHVILFSGGSLEYLEKYQELCVDEVTAFRCNQDDATLLSHLKTQLDSALTAKINNPGRSWESISAVVVRAIVKLLRDDGVGSRNLTIIDRRAPRAPLTDPLMPVESQIASQSEIPADQPFRTSKSCFVCGDFGHVSRFCPHSAANNKGGPPVRCFICGQWHYPQDCTLVKPMAK